MDFDPSRQNPYSKHLPTLPPPLNTHTPNIVLRGPPNQFLKVIKLSWIYTWFRHAAQTVPYLHDCPVDDDEVLRRGLHRPAFSGIARIEEQRGPLQTDPVALPSPLPGKLNLQNTTGSSLVLYSRRRKREDRFLFSETKRVLLCEKIS